MIKEMAKTIKWLRKQYPNNDVPESIFENPRTPEVVFGEDASMTSTRRFRFDDDVLTSEAYRRSMMFAQSIITSKGKGTVVQKLETRADANISVAVRSVQVEEKYIVTAPASNTLKPIERPRAAKRVWTAPSELRSIRAYRFYKRQTWLETFNTEDFAPVMKTVRSSDVQSCYWEMMTAISTKLELMDIYMTCIRDRLASYALTEPLEDPVYNMLILHFDSYGELFHLFWDELYRPMLVHWETNGPAASFNPLPLLNFVSRPDLTFTAYLLSSYEAYEYLATKFKTDDRIKQHIYHMLDERTALQLDLLENLVHAPKLLIKEVIDRLVDLGAFRDSVSSKEWIDLGTAYRELKEYFERVNDKVDKRIQMSQSLARPTSIYELDTGVMVDSVIERKISKSLIENVALYFVSQLQPNVTNVSLTIIASWLAQFHLYSPCK
jgi:hypothetical protein